MIDIHCHVLPGIDDGPADVAGSLALVRYAAAEGIHTIVATPHAREDFPGVHLEEVASRCRALAAELPPELCDMELLPGAEVDLVWAQTASDDELALASLGQGGHTLLLETPYGPLPSNFVELVVRVQRRGFRIVLAHPEWNPTVQRRPEIVRELVERSVLVQVTAGALARGRRRSRSGRLAFDLVESRLAHVLATDAHTGGDWRPPRLTAGLEALAEIAPERALWMVTEAPAAVLAGDHVPAGPRPERRRSGFARLLGR